MAQIQGEQAHSDLGQPEPGRQTQPRRGGGQPEPPPPRDDEVLAAGPPDPQGPEHDPRQTGHGRQARRQHHQKDRVARRPLPERARLAGRAGVQDEAGQEEHVQGDQDRRGRVPQPAIGVA